MKKNVAAQVVGAQMCSATDGSAFTAAVTVFVTGDGGAQAVGSVGAGACVHEGNGFHTYLPAQAETNYDHVAFTFTGTGAIPASVQIYPSFPQSGDSFARVGAPVGASISADVAAVKAETATILADTNDIQTRLPAALVSGRMDSSVGAMAANVLTATAVATGAITAAKFAAGALDAAALAADAGTEIGTAVWASAARTLTANTNFNDLNAAGIRAAVGLAAANLDTQLDALPTTAEVKAQVVAALATDTYAEGGVPAATATLANKLGWLFVLARNEIRQTSTTQSVRNDANLADLATAAVADDGTTFTRSEFV